MFFTPLISMLFLGTIYISPAKFIIILTILIIIPFVLSRFLRRIQWDRIILRYRSLVINWGFFFVAYTIIGLNRDIFLTAPLKLFRLILVAFLSTFILGYFIENVSKLLNVSEKDRISIMLIGTRKNYGLAAAIALLFFDARTTTSIAVGMSMAILHFIWLNFRIGRKDSKKIEKIEQ
jgi:BASS family bile acid:Na+ symporter